MCRSRSVDLHGAPSSTSPRSSWRAEDEAAARGAGIPGIFSCHEKTNNASQAFEKWSGSSLLVTLTTYSMGLFEEVVSKGGGSAPRSPAWYPPL